MNTMQANRSEILAATKYLMKERSNDEVSAFEAEKIAQNATEFFRLLLRWDENLSVDTGANNGR